MSVVDRWHKARPKPDEAKCSCRPAKVPTAEHGRGERWQVRYRDDTGRQRKENFGKLPNAQSRDAEIKASLDTGAYIDKAAGDVTLEKYAAEWREQRTGDPGTLQQVDSRLRKWVYGQPIGKRTLTELAKRPNLTRTWIKTMSETLAPGSIKLVLDTVGAILDQAAEDRAMSRNPLTLQSVRAVRPVNVDDKKVVPWTMAQVSAMGGALPGRVAAIPYVGAGCALRQGELFGLGEDDVDFDAAIVHVRRQVRLIGGRLVFSLPKRNKTRSVPLPPSVAEHLRAHLEAFPSARVELPWRKPDGDPHAVRLVFTTAARGAYHRNTFNYMWRVGLEVAGIVPPRVTGQKRKPYPDQMCHVLRHTAASAWLAAGVDIVTVAEYLGHNDPGFTLRTYTHLMPSAADRARTAMETFFANVSSALVVP